MKKKVVSILLAGGIGERLYPISSGEHPKFLLKIRGKSLIRLTYERAKKLCGIKSVYIVSTTNLKPKILSALPEFPEENFIEEPMRKNTLPAFALSLIKIPPDGNVMCFFPCDHIIEKEKKFVDTVNHAVKIAMKDFITLIGIKPTTPSTHYGYIIPGKKIDKKAALVKTFVEKPDAKKAERLVKKGALWNSGIYVLSRATLERTLREHQENVFKKFIEKKEKLVEVYEGLEAISFDRGITEKERRRAVVKGEFFWCDIGTIDSLVEYVKKKKSVVTGGNVVVEDSKRVIAVSWRHRLFLKKACDIMITDDGEKVEIKGIKDGRKEGK